MRLALISDVHGNDVAFRTVVEDIQRIGVDAVVSLGDVAQGGPQPAETLDRLQSLGCRAVMGNSDAFLLELPRAAPEPITSEQLEVREWSLSLLSDDDISLMRSFESVVELDLEGQAIACFHGSPLSYDDILLPESSGTALRPYEAQKADLLAGGHTHKQWTRRIENSLFVNPGSVGLPYDHHQPDDDFKLTPISEYALVLIEDAGLAVEFRRVPFPLDELRAVAAASGRPHAGDYIDWWRG